MSAQTRYAFSTPSGMAGGIVDLAPYAIDTLLVGNDTGVLKFGTGVVQSDKKAGSEVILPTKKGDKFEGITVNNLTTEYDLEGKIHIRKGASIGVMRYGRIYARVASDKEPKYGETAYLIFKDDDKHEVGYFTNSSEPEKNIEIAGRFLSEKDAANGVAVIELFNAPNPDAGE